MNSIDLLDILPEDIRLMATAGYLLAQQSGMNADEIVADFLQATEHLDNLPGRREAVECYLRKLAAQEKTYDLENKS